MAGGSVQNLKSTCDKSIFSQQLTTKHGMDLKLLQSIEFENNEWLSIEIELWSLAEAEKNYFWKNQNPLTGAFCQIIFVLRKISTFLALQRS